MSDHGETDELLRALRSRSNGPIVVFERAANKYYSNADGLVTFNPFHSGQYSIFLYSSRKPCGVPVRDSLLTRCTT